MDRLLREPAVGLVLTILAYYGGAWIKARLPSPLANPIAIGGALIILVVCLTPLTMDQYQAGGGLVTLFMVPATTVLALHIHRQWELLRKNIIPVFIGCFIGSIVSIASVTLLCDWFGLDQMLAASLKPKSVTTAIAIELAIANGGIGPIAVAAVILTGAAGAIIGPWLIRCLRLRGEVEIGVAMGASAHAIGTATALGIGEQEGAMSGIALVLTGIITTAIYVIFL